MDRIKLGFACAYVPQYSNDTQAQRLLRYDDVKWKKHTAQRTNNTEPTNSTERQPKSTNTERSKLRTTQLFLWMSDERELEHMRIQTVQQQP